MGSFQIVYDDFSGGQYMGPTTIQPKNTYFGSDVMTSPSGRLIPGGIGEAVQQNPAVATPNSGAIYDYWHVGNYAYAFVEWVKSSTKYPRMIAHQVNNGAIFPVTPTVTTLTGSLNGKVAYDPTSTKFFYVDVGNIRTVTTGGTVALASSALSATGVTDIALYNFRMVVWGGTSNRLYFSDTNLTTYSTSNYYEFSGKILNVLPRANDLLVFCTTGVFSLVGVLGSGVTSQLVVPQDNIMEGMKDAVVVGRTAYFMDQTNEGAIDGRIYRLVGSRVEVAATIEYSDLENNQNVAGAEQARMQVVSNSTVAVQLKSGVIYSMNPQGQWARFTSSPAQFADAGLTKQFLLARAGTSAQNEYFLAAGLDDEFVFNARRYIRSVPIPTNADANFTYVSGASAPTDAQPGTAILSEYWHQKPFSVKQALVEFQNRTTSTRVIVYVQQTGVIDATDAQQWNNYSSTATFDGTGGFYADLLKRAYVNDANKGHGVKVLVNIRDTMLHRVILICED